MSTSVRNKIRYSVVYPLRYASDKVRSQLSGAGSTASRILIAGDNRAVTSDEQFTPLLAHRNTLRRELGVVFDQRLIDEVLVTDTVDTTSYDAVLAKLSFTTPRPTALRMIERLRHRFPHPIKIIYFDGDDDSCIQWGSEFLESVDVYVKKHMFSDVSWYRKQFAGKNNLTDYIARVHGRSFADDLIPSSGIVQESQLTKIVLGYNIAMDRKITDLFRNTRPAASSEKTVDVMCRAACNPDFWIYPFRAPIGEALAPLTKQGYKVLVPNQRVDQKGYYQEMRSSRISVSPFGYGELCWRDFETVLMGSMLVKPDMSHIRTEPDIFVPGETYVPVRWDFSDLAEVCRHYLANEEARNAIVGRAYQALSDYYSSFGFLRNFRETLTRADVRPLKQSTLQQPTKYPETRN
jgi:Glycosyl transferases group 1